MEVQLVESTTGMSVTTRSGQVVQGPPCAPVTDSVIGHPGFRAKVDTLLQKSIISRTNPANRQEWAFEVFRDVATGALRLGPIIYSGTACGISLPVPIGTPTEEVDYVVHSHPHFRGENVRTACGNPNAMPYDPRANGGGSNADWGYTTRYGRAVYAVSPEWMHKLVPNPDSVGRVNNPNRYQRQSTGCWRHRP
jgi:hypothetical protein